MNRRQKHAKAGGGWQRPTEQLVNEWLRPQYKQNTFRALRGVAAWNKWEHGSHRFADAAWKRTRRRQAKQLLALGGVEVKAKYVYDYDPYDDEDTIERRAPLGRRWLDYVPLQGSREYCVASGEDYPGHDTGYFVPGWSFDERLDYYHRAGMPKHDAWERARLSVLRAAHDYLRRDNGEISVTVTVDGEQYIGEDGYSQFIRLDQDQYVDCDDPQDVLEVVAEHEGLNWIIRRVQQERAELAAGQVGPI